MTGVGQGSYVTNCSRTHRPDETAALQARGSLSRGNSRVTLTLRNITTNPYRGRGKPTSALSRACGVTTDTAYLVFGVRHPGTDTKALLKIDFRTSPTPCTDTPAIAARINTSAPKLQTVSRDGPVTVFNLDSTGQLRTHDSIAIATGYIDNNAWLSWITATVRFLGLSDCVACASARPDLVSSPVLFNFTDDPIGSHCMLALFMTTDPTGCDLLSSLFPPGLIDSPTGILPW